MFAMPEKINAVCHPLIDSMYVKHEMNGKDVLIIETNFSQDQNDSDLYMTELLFDLENLKDLAEEKAGHIDRVDIRTLN